MLFYNLLFSLIFAHIFFYVNMLSEYGQYLIMFCFMDIL